MKLDELNSVALKNCNFIKVILMAFVILYHSMAFYVDGWFSVEKVYIASPVFRDIALYFNSFHTYGFVFVSGYIFAFLKYENGKYNEFAPFVKTKIKRLLIPYVLASIFWVIPWTCFYYNFSFIEVLKRYAIGISPSQLWFLLMLFLVFIAMYFLSSLIYNRIFLGIVLLLGLYCLGIMGDCILPNVFQIFTALKYLIFFFVGMLFRKGLITYAYRVPTMVWILIDLILYYIYNFILQVDNFVFKVLTIGMELTVHMIGAIMIFVVLNNIASRIKYNNSCIYVFLNENNFTFYLFHQQIIYGVITLFNGQVSSIVLVTVNFVVSIGVSALIAIVLNQYKLTRVAIGKKQ